MAKAKTTKAPTLWLVREPKKYGGWYYVSSGSKPRKPKDGWTGTNDNRPLCPEAWHLLCPKSVHLRPSGGPIRITVQRVPTTKGK